MPERVRIYIKERREALGLSQLALADQLGVSGAAVSFWESGTSVPGGARLLALARVLKCTTDELFVRPTEIIAG